MLQKSRKSCLTKLLDESIPLTWMAASQLDGRYGQGRQGRSTAPSMGSRPILTTSKSTTVRPNRTPWVCRRDNTHDVHAWRKTRNMKAHCKMRFRFIFQEKSAPYEVQDRVARLQKCRKKYRSAGNCKLHT